MRPCHCERYGIGPYERGQCRLCWLYHNDPAYRALWSEGEPMLDMLSPQPVRSQPCVHRGAAVREEQCSSCLGRVRLKVFACALHEYCTVARALPGCACCTRCPDYAPLSTGDSSGPPDSSIEEPSS